MGAHILHNLSGIAAKEVRDLEYPLYHTDTHVSPPSSLRLTSRFYELLSQNGTIVLIGELKCIMMC